MALKKLLCVSAMFVVISAPVVAAETVDDHGKPMHEQEHAPVAHGAIGAHEAVETHAGDLTVPPGRHDMPEAASEPEPEREPIVDAHAQAVQDAVEAHAEDYGKPAYERPHHEEWGYDATMGAHNWGVLNKNFQACLKGKMQSPVNIDRYAEQEMPPLRAAYGQSNLKVTNNGHTVQVDYEVGSTLESDGKVYALKQIHFHTPSEHYIDGAPYPMEVHFVHQAEDAELAVIGVMMKIGEKNETIQKIWEHIPGKGETVVAKDLKISAANLLPRTGIYFKYDGSLTTPPCSEGVKWHVMQDPITISADQLNAFQSLYPVNARPVQSLNGRIIQGG